MKPSVEPGSSLRQLVGKVDFCGLFSKITRPIEGIAGFANAQFDDLGGASAGAFTTVS